MSIEEATAFIQHVRTHTTLQETIQKLTGRDVLEKMSHIGAIEGYAFSQEEYREAIVLDADGGLSEEAIMETMAEMNMKPKEELATEE